MYGKAFASMYTGSLVGAGLHVFGVWNYCIATCRFGVIELNPRILAFILGAEEKQIEEAVHVLCSEDPKSRSKEKNGRRLIKTGEYQYEIVNWKYYERIKNEFDRKEYNARKQQQYRLRKKGVLPTELEKAMDEGVSEEDAERFEEQYAQPAAE